MSLHLPQKNSLQRLFSWIISFETLFVLYLFAGFYKAAPLLAWAPIDLTLFFLIMSVIAGGWILWQRGFRVSRNALQEVVSMVAFACWMLLSLIWAPPTQYGLEKAIQFAILNVWALAGAALVLDGNRERLRRFYVILLLLAAIFALEAMRIYLPHPTLRSFNVFGSNYQSLGRIIGMGFIIATGAFFTRFNVPWKYWIVLGLNMLFFLVLLFIGARGPFLAATGVAFLMVFLAKNAFQRKALWIAAMIIIYLMSSWWLGPNLRTIYRMNVILVHKIGWEIPIDQPTPEIIPTHSPVKAKSGAPRSATVTLPLAINDATSKPVSTPSPTKSKRPNPKQASNKSFDQRVQMFINAWHLWLTAPFIGAGIGSFAFFYPKDQLRVYPHNILLETLSELGIVGAVLLFTMIFFAFKGFSHKGTWRRTETLFALGIFLYTAINALLSGDLVSNRHFFMALGLLAATQSLRTKYDDL